MSFIFIQSYTSIEEQIKFFQFFSFKYIPVLIIEHRPLISLAGHIRARTKKFQRGLREADEQNHPDITRVDKKSIVFVMRVICRDALHIFLIAV